MHGAGQLYAMRLKQSKLQCEQAVSAGVQVTQQMKVQADGIPSWLAEASVAA